MGGNRRLNPFIKSRSSKSTVLFLDIVLFDVDILSSVSFTDVVGTPSKVFTVLSIPRHKAASCGESRIFA